MGEAKRLRRVKGSGGEEWNVGVGEAELLRELPTPFSPFISLYFGL